MGFRRIALVMAGGSGTRFWPASTQQRPKQFLRLTNRDRSLLQESVERARLIADEVYVATSEQLRTATEGEIKDTLLLCEPERKNTLGALIWSVAHIKHTLGDAWRDCSMAVLTADHLIQPESAFESCVKCALDTAESTGALVTIGVSPSRAATEYGYIQLGERTGGDTFSSRRFVEKPDQDTASEYLASGDYLWNSGMFFWTLPSFCTELERCAPESTRVLDRLTDALANSDAPAAQAAFSELDAQSIDYALMEKAHSVKVVRAAFKWDDLGSWDALSRSLPLDDEGNSRVGAARCVESRDCVTYVAEEGVRVSLLGVSGLIVVVANGEVLVCPKDRAQDVRNLAD